MKPDQQSAKLLETIGNQPIIPIIEITNTDSAQLLASLFVEIKLPVIEVVLRTEQALEAISLMKQVPDCTVGAGSIFSRKMCRQAVEAGAEFIIAPGSTDQIIDECTSLSVPFLPGVCTATEAMYLRELGYRFMKFFPAEPAGGIHTLKALYGPLPDLCYCPTGGINSNNMLDYLSLNNVKCIGGSWIAPQDQIAQKNWSMIKAHATDAHDKLNV